MSTQRMSSLMLVRWIIIGALSLGMAILITLILEFSSPLWSRPALMLQGLAFLCALILIRQQGHRGLRFLWYVILLASAIYLWDATLPPPTLPDGVWRILIPKLIMVGILSHVFFSLQAQRQNYRTEKVEARGTQVIAGYVNLLDVAEMFNLAPTEIRTHLSGQYGELYVDADGREYVHLLAFLSLIKRIPVQEQAIHILEAPPHTTNET